MKIAVALATYNGSRFLKEQLHSLSQQIRKPDHLVISDDASSDDTLAIAGEFQRTAPFRVDVLSDGTRLGPMGNFLRAADACDAEYIAFCDQDDIWFPEKLELCAKILQLTRSLAIVHAAAYFTTQTSKIFPAGKVKMHHRVVDGLQVQPHETALGMCMVVQKSLFEPACKLRKSWEPRFENIVKERPLCLFDHWSHGHDMSIFTTARLLGKFTFTNLVLARHRVHENNYSNGGSTWAQSPDIEGSWGQERNRGYRLLSSHCDDFANMLREDLSISLSDQRRQAALEYYRRWSAIWGHRAMLNAPDARLGSRAIDLLSVARTGGYRARYDGGLGMPSLAKDLLNTLGLQVS